MDLVDPYKLELSQRSFSTSTMRTMDESMDQRVSGFIGLYAEDNRIWAMYLTEPTERVKQDARDVWEGR